MRRTIGVLALLLLTALAGCADPAPEDETGTGDDPPPVQATKTTGGIRGVIVDASITPIPAATVTLKETGDEITTDDKGTFVFNGLEPGFYNLQATKQLYDTVTATTQVEAGISDPDAVKIQLTRLTNTEPYAPTNTFDGYLFCSLNVVVPDTTYILSEECGEGVGVPGMGRIGGNPDNAAQIDFFIDSAEAKTMMAEFVWTPSLTVGVTGAFNGGIYTDFACDPSCSWSNQIDRNNGDSPLVLRSDNGQAEGFGLDGDIESFVDAGFDEETKFSTFTWASSDDTGVLLEQPFKVYQTTSYVLPLPEDWSFADGDTSPFA